MNVTEFNHSFVNIGLSLNENDVLYQDFSDWKSYYECHLKSTVSLFRCYKCNMSVMKFPSYSKFYLNSREIFKDQINLQQINLTCEELQIKFLLE